jgi:sulfide dehydrogenase cytochrome subunit
VRKMQEFRAGKRPATVMERIARGFDDNDIAALAKYFAHK